MVQAAGGNLGEKMPNYQFRDTARFECEDDDGRRYVVIQREQWMFWQTADGKRHQDRIGTTYRLADGREVDRRGEDEFEIVATEVLIRKIG